MKKIPIKQPVQWNITGVLITAKVTLSESQGVGCFFCSAFKIFGCRRLGFIIRTTDNDDGLDPHKPVKFDLSSGFIMTNTQ